MVDLVEISEERDSIVVDMRYATTNNFTGKKLYSRPLCFLRKNSALKLLNAQNILVKRGLGLKVWDAYRPQSVQEFFWSICPDDNFIANPKIGSNHSRGAAVDVTLVNSLKEELVMPTLFDEFSPRAHRSCPDIPSEALKNSRLLETVMVSSGFVPNIKEWWHFNDVDYAQYEILNLSFEELRRK